MTRGVWKTNHSKDYLVRTSLRSDINSRKRRRQDLETNCWKEWYVFDIKSLPVLFGANLLLQLSLLPFQLAQRLLLRQQLVVAAVQPRHVFFQGLQPFADVPHLRLAVLRAVTTAPVAEVNSRMPAESRWESCLGAHLPFLPLSAAPADTSAPSPQWCGGIGRQKPKSCWCWSCGSRRTSSMCTVRLLWRTPLGWAL